MYAFSAGRGPCARVAACRTCDVPSRVNLVLSLYSMYIELLYPIVWWRTRASLYPFAHQSEICEIDLSDVKIPRETESRKRSLTNTRRHHPRVASARAARAPKVKVKAVYKRTELAKSSGPPVSRTTAPEHPGAPGAAERGAGLPYPS